MTLIDAATKIIHHFRFNNGISLNASHVDSLVNVLEYWEVHPKKTVKSDAALCLMRRSKNAGAINDRCGGNADSVSRIRVRLNGRPAGGDCGRHRSAASSSEFVIAGHRVTIFVWLV